MEETNKCHSQENINLHLSQIAVNNVISQRDVGVEGERVVDLERRDVDLYPRNSLFV